MSRFDRPDPSLDSAYTDGLRAEEPESVCASCGAWVDETDVAFPLCPSCAEHPILVAARAMREGRA